MSARHISPDLRAHSVVQMRVLLYTCTDANEPLGSCVCVCVCVFYVYKYRWSLLAPISISAINLHCVETLEEIKQFRSPPSIPPPWALCFPCCSPITAAAVTATASPVPHLVLRDLVLLLFPPQCILLHQNAFSLPCLSLPSTNLSSSASPLLWQHQCSPRSCSLSHLHLIAAASWPHMAVPCLLVSAPISSCTLLAASCFPKSLSLHLLFIIRVLCWSVQFHSAAPLQLQPALMSACKRAANIHSQQAFNYYSFSCSISDVK